MAGWCTTEGAILPLGAQWIEEERAYNFSIYSEHAERVTLLLFDEDDPAVPLLEHRLDPWVNKTWHVWHCRLGEEMIFGARYYAYENVPDNPVGNWRWRCTDGMLSASAFQWLRDLTETSNRSFPPQSPCLSEVTP